MSPNIYEVRKRTSSWTDVLLNMHLQTYRKAHYHRCLAGISIPNGAMNYAGWMSYRGTSSPQDVDIS